MPIKIRAPRNGDESRLADLCEEMGYACRAAEVAKRLQALAQHDDHAVLVATGSGDEPIGFAHVHLSRRLMVDAFAELGGLVVGAQHRSKRIGEKLLLEAERWGVQKGVDVFRVRSNAIRDRAHRFYLRAGYIRSKTSYVFEKRLT
jgi:GNAT superfamily N-acetyltransferase